MAKRASRRSRGPEPLKFDQRLVLNQWMLGLFRAETLDDLAKHLKGPELEGFDEDNVSHFHGVLALRMYELPELPKDVLLGYDQNIVRHWRAITERRERDGHRMHPKYFQYLALLFTEIYLDRYFRDPAELLKALNEHVEQFNRGEFLPRRSGTLLSELPRGSEVKPFEREDLNKLAYWQATGSGKTLLMHCNIRQYQHYLDLHDAGRRLNRVILLTPNEGLSRQHLEEFERSGIRAELFSKEARGLFAGRDVEILDIHKLRDEMGDKTVAIDAFEGNNLVLVDEGHRGSSGEEWKSKRDRLCENGFSFEYSATFGQAMKAAKKEALTQEYARCILFDYSYKYFYRDGYGKDYQILNLEDDSKEDERQLYLTACLLVYYQQLRLYEDEEESFRPFLLEKPLWVFVGGRVTAVRTEGGRQRSDVTDVLLFLADAVSKRTITVARIERLLSGRAGLHDKRGHELFLNAFGYLKTLSVTPEQALDDLLKRVFHAPAPAKLHVDELKGTDGELALRLGENPPFGVINVGDAPKLRKLCETYPDAMVTEEKEFSGSLFRGLNNADSTINLLIGSKKFSEGWNSWRVSTMGLMKVGKNEGSEIIQLFGRGVRLKGYEFGLKRSRHVVGVEPPKHIESIETLNIFGIRSDYMRQFQEYLEDEGLPANEQRDELVLPVIHNLGTKKLRMVRLKEGLDFKKTGPKPTLGPPPERLLRNLVTVDWYPKIQAQQSKDLRSAGDVAVKEIGWLKSEHLAFMDMDAVWFELQRYKNERAWYNLNLPRDAAMQLLASPDWYRLYIPPERLELTSFDRVRQWQEIAVTLLKKYCDRYYKLRKAEYELPNMEYRDLDPEDPNFITEYRFLIDQSQQAIASELEKLKQAILAGNLREVEVGNLHAIRFAQHLYEPLIHLKSDHVEVRPVPLNAGERDFVVDLREFHAGNSEFFADRELYLLRNLSRGRGVGFFEAENFYPDFILWLLAGGRQYVAFVDPKGIRNLRGLDDPKIRFCRTVKDLQDRLGDPNVLLSSFIVSNTPHRQVGWWGNGLTKEEFEDRHVLFQKDDPRGYVSSMMHRILQAE